LVINQEHQVVPAFVLELDTSNFSKLSSYFDREVVENPESAAFNDLDVYRMASVGSMDVSE